MHDSTQIDHGSSGHDYGRDAGGSHHGPNGHVQISFTHNGPHFTLTSNLREAGGRTVQQDAAQDRQGDTRKTLGASIPTVDGNGKQISDYVVHIAIHGKFAMVDHVRKIAADMNLVLLDYVRPNMDPVNDLIYDKIKGWDAWAQETDGVVYIMPDGYYQDATGTTTPFRTYYQVGVAEGSTQVFDKEAHTYLEISAITWRYFETGDYETRFQARIVFVPEWDTDKQAWGYRKAPFEKHQLAAIQFCHRILEGLRKSPPSELSVGLRKLVLPSDKPRTTDPEGWHGATAREEFERVRDEMQRIAQVDYQTAIDAISGPIVPAPTDPQGNTVDIEADLQG